MHERISTIGVHEVQKRGMLLDIRLVVIFKGEGDKGALGGFSSAGSMCVVQPQAWVGGNYAYDLCK